VILPISVVTIQGASPDLADDIENSDTVWGGECGVFVDVVSSVIVDDPSLLVLSQTDCLVSGHVVSSEEDALFDLGRNTGADVVVYYIQSDVAGFRGCAAHPAARRGCWVGDSATDWTFIHEITHVVGDNRHVGTSSECSSPGSTTNSDNLMFICGTASITDLPPDLSEEQCRRILNDPALLDVASIVLNL